MEYSSLVYNLLQSAVWSITPALPVGAPGTRLTVGVPEKIPDFTFITRRLIAGDGFPMDETNHLNGFIDNARTYHALFGLTLNEVNSFEQILNFFANRQDPIGRIRFVSHGNDAFLFVPMFVGGSWAIGIQDDFVKALKISDEAAVRFWFSDTTSPTQSPLFTDIVDTITLKTRAQNAALLAPFGIDAGGPATGMALPYFEIVNDLYQVSHGSIGVETAPGTFTPITSAQRATLTNALNLIEPVLRQSVVGKVFGTAPAVTDLQSRAFRDGVLAIAPGPFGLFGGPINLVAGTVSNVAAATAANPQVEDDIRMAFTGGAVVSPVFSNDHLTALVRSLELFNNAVLNLGGGTQDDASIRGNPDLEALTLVGVDLFMLKNGAVIQNGTTLTAGERGTLRNGLLALSNIIRSRILGVAGTQFTAPRLNALRDAIENIPYRQSTILGAVTYQPITISEIERMTTAMRADFRTKLEHFRALMRPADASNFDIRGCLVGRTPSFLLTLREFMGTAANRPRVSAPEWWQSFPVGGVDHRFSTPIRMLVDTLVSGGIAPNISGADVDGAATTWRGLIDFDPHFDFIKALFTGGATQRDFASLRWRVFKTSSAPQGIPVLRMQASRVDDLDTLQLGVAIERFREIFEIASTSTPDATTRGRLNQITQHIVRLKTLSDALAAIAAPTQTQIDQFVTDLSSVVTGVSGTSLPGGTAPTSPGAGAVLATLQNYVNDVGVFIDTKLGAALNPFFAAMQIALGDANAPIRYFYNVGLPLLLQSSTTPPDTRLSTRASAGAISGMAMLAGAVRSWMRIQWEGTPAQAATMNTRIQNLPLNTFTQLTAASQLARLTEFDPESNVFNPTGIAPMQTYADHIVTRPP